MAKSISKPSSALLLLLLSCCTAQTHAARTKLPRGSQGAPKKMIRGRSLQIGKRKNDKNDVAPSEAVGTSSPSAAPSMSPTSPPSMATAPPMAATLSTATAPPTSSASPSSAPSDQPSGAPTKAPAPASLGFETDLLSDGTTVTECVEGAPATGVVDTLTVDFMYSVYLDASLTGDALAERVNRLEVQLHEAIAEDEMDCKYQSDSFDINKLTTGKVDSTDGACGSMGSVAVSPAGQTCHMVQASVVMSLYYPGRRRKLELDSVLIGPVAKILMDAMAKVVETSDDIDILELQAFSNTDANDGATGDPSGGGKSGPASAVDGNTTQQPTNSGPGLVGSIFIGLACVVFIVAVVAIAQRHHNRKAKYEEHLEELRQTRDDDSLYLVAMGRQADKERLRQMHAQNIDMEDEGDISRMNGDDSYYMEDYSQSPYDDESAAPIPPDINVVSNPLADRKQI